MPGQGQQGRAGLGPVGAAVEAHLAAARPRPAPTRARPRARGIGSVSGSSAASVAVGREEVGDGVVAGEVERLAVGRDSRAAAVRAAASAHLLAEHGLHGDLGAVELPGDPQARASRAPAARARGSSASASSTATGSQSASSSRRVRSIAGPRSRASARVNVHGDLAGAAGRPSSTRTTPGPCGSRSDALVPARPKASSPRTACSGQEAVQVVGRRTARARRSGCGSCRTCRGCAAWRPCGAARSASRRTPRGRCR